MIHERSQAMIKKLAWVVGLTLLAGLFSIPSNANELNEPGLVRFQVFDTWRNGDGSRIGLFSETNGVKKYHGNCETLAPGYKSTGPLFSSCNPRDYKVKLVPSVDLVAPVCDGGKEYCLESVHATAGGNTLKGQFIGYLNPSSTVKAVPKFGIPDGASSSIWRIPGQMHSGGSDYYQVKLDMIANVGLWFYILRGELGEGRPLEITNFDLRIRPVTMSDPTDATSATLCEQCSMPSEATFRVNALMNHDILGMKWFYSRITNADVKITKIQGGQYRYAISGKPMALQVMDARASYSAAPKAVIDLHIARNKNCKEQSVRGCHWAVVNGNRPWEAEEMLAAWRPVVGDSATRTVNQWFIRSNYQDAGQWFNDRDFYRCAPKDKAAGFVTSNALMTTGSIPSYRAGTLDYKVSSLHFEEDGVTPYKGFYEFAMDEKLARCLFKFPAVPISARITVRGTTGDTDVETVVAGNTNGMMRFVAANFGYSNKTISVRFEPKGFKTCVKGSSVRYVKSSKCPAGFK